MKKLTLLFVFALALIFAASCQTEDGNGSSKSNVIKISLDENNATKAEGIAAGSEHFFSIPFVDANGETLTLDAYISDIPSESPATMTKGVPLETSNLAAVYSSFGTSLYKGTGIYVDEVRNIPMSGKTVASKGEGEWELSGGPYYWPSDGSDIVFCSEVPSGASTVTDIDWNNGARLSFTYTQPAPSEASPFNDAKNQKDLMFGINRQNRNSHVIGGESYAWINFSHALTAVKFIRGDIGSCTISSVSLKNFKSTGKAEASPNGSNGLTFTWTDQSTPKTFKQDFNNAIGTAGEEGAVPDKGSLDPSMYDADASNDGECTFMMIPQVLASNATIEIEILSESHTYTISVNLGSITDAEAGNGNAAKLKDWSTYAGKVITFRVNNASVSDVTISEDYDGKIKENVGAENIGSVTEFVRAAVVANWVDKNGNSLWTCDITSEGELTGYLLPGSNWIQHTDGFIYYTKAIAPGKVTAGKIFKKYVPAEAPASTIHHLDLIILLQSVEYDPACAKAMEAWGIPEGILTSEIE